MDSEDLATPLYFTWSYPVAWQRRFEVMTNFIGTVFARDRQGKLCKEVLARLLQGQNKHKKNEMAQTISKKSLSP